MDCSKVGSLIAQLRKEKGFTQLMVAEKLGVSDKAVSKWERGLGCPDISLLNELAEILGVNVSTILEGHIDKNDKEIGNMKRLNFYVCPECGNIITASGSGEISCCGKKLAPLQAKKSDEKHSVKIEDVEDEYYITSSHSMTKEHYISFVAYVSFDRIMLVKTYPEQDMAMRFPKMHSGDFYFYCVNDGLYKM